MIDPRFGLFDVYRVMLGDGAAALVSVTAAPGALMLAWAVFDAWRIRSRARWALGHEQQPLDDASPGLRRLRVLPGDAEPTGRGYAWIESGELRQRRDLPSLPFDALAEVERGRAIVPAGYRSVEARPARLRIAVACPSFAELRESAWSPRRTALALLGLVFLLPLVLPLLLIALLLATAALRG